ncbi:hypothetical protein Fcan01_28309 [Folsomia candida]|uniref:Uncharacterized protein n=1 Tax=Folsomia candida TaxID=158441 RepID=A0A226CVA8_FOLCA|nr:hypothetical protein Fcan01_28309 [Folsomia candida]
MSTFPRKSLSLCILVFILTPSQADPAPSHLTSILDIFSHCTLIVTFTTNQTDFLAPLHPLLIYVENFPSQPQYGPFDRKFLFTNVSFTRRRQAAKFCWTCVFPDLGVKFAYSNLLHSPIFPRLPGSAYPIHIIWLVPAETNSAQVQTICEKILFPEIMYLGSREYHFSQPGFNGTEHFYHLNLYRPLTSRNFPVSAKFEFLLDINCSPKSKMECYQSIEDAAHKIAMTYNKFAWVYYGWLILGKIETTFTQTFMEMKKKYFHLKQSPDWIQVANQSESLDDFVAYTVLSDSLFNMSVSRIVDRNRKYVFHAKTRQYNSNIHQVVLTGSRSYSFLSCYGIQKENSYKAFIDPFDKYVWLCIITVVVIFSSIRGMITCSLQNVDASILSVAVLLEISVPNINKVFPSQLNYVFWIWIFCAVLLTSLYKTIFTAEVILPYKRSPLWTHIYDLQDQGFQFFVPIIPYSKLYYDLYTNGAPLHHTISFQFFPEMAIAADYAGDSPRLLGYKRFAKALLDTRSNSNKDMRIFRRNLHYKWPSHVYPNLSRCADKLAYLDENENIKDIIPYLNDNVDGIVFMDGADEDFLLTWYAIQIYPTPRRNFVLDRVKFLMVSGIYKRWEDWFSKRRPKKLFPYYDNWTRPKVMALEKMDFTSRVVTTLKIWGICCGLSAVVGIIEVCYEQVHYLRRVVEYALLIIENG